MLYPDVTVNYPPDPNTFIICGATEIESSMILELTVPPPFYLVFKLDIDSRKVDSLSSHQVLHFCGSHLIYYYSTNYSLLRAHLSPLLVGFLLFLLRCIYIQMTLVVIVAKSGTNLIFGVAHWHVFPYARPNI
jgi:hypothetical protein